MIIREAAVAGQFYPSEPAELKAHIDSYLSAVKDPRPAPKAFIAPHAGTIYSGPIAATAYATLRAVRDRIKRVILLGPAHHTPVMGLVGCRADFFNTPLGEIPVDQAGIEDLCRLDQVNYFDEAHRIEHSLEVHLPFLQETLADFVLVPLLVGQTEPQDVAEVIEQAWGGSETLIIVSSDLSHYLPYEAAREIDEKTSRAIEQLRWEDLAHDQACGYYPVRGLLATARKRDMQVTRVDLRNSGDTAGTKEGVVGYGSYLFNET